jgi:hypothetical protein
MPLIRVENNLFRNLIENLPILSSKNYIFLFMNDVFLIFYFINLSILIEFLSSTMIFSYIDSFLIKNLEYLQNYFHHINLNFKYFYSSLKLKKI